LTNIYTPNVANCGDVHLRRLVWRHFKPLRKCSGTPSQGRFRLWWLEVHEGSVLTPKKAYLGMPKATNRAG